ncbi:hypothetical protein Gotri_025103 [Gossypium trilobum]|uniref:Uncharacterized protein n=1 Tax=Gossypium trilobum TaxID=34281 RepID=A0A7J9FKE1_9ROSI|nr:hypothetical protein [Gossypium trilobum]
MGKVLWLTLGMIMKTLHIPRLYLGKCPGPTRYISTKGTHHHKTSTISSRYLNIGKLPNRFRFQSRR